MLVFLPPVSGFAMASFLRANVAQRANGNADWGPLGGRCSESYEGIRKTGVTVAMVVLRLLSGWFQGLIFAGAMVADSAAIAAVAPNRAEQNGL